MAGDFNKTEEAILDEYAPKVPDANEGGDNGEDGQDGQQQQQDGQNQTQPKKEEGDPKAKPEGKGDGKGDPKGAKPGQPPKPGEQPKPGVKDQRQPAQVQPGAERRVFERMTNDIRERDKQISTLSQQVEGYKSTMGFLGQLETHEVSRVTEIAKLYKTNPIEAVTQFLIGAKQDGVDLSKLNLATIDTEAIKGLLAQHVDAKLQPLLDDRNSSVRNAEAQNSARQELDDFLADNPDAEQHLDAVAGLMEKFPSLSLGGAWDKIQIWSYKNGINLQQPPAGATSPQASTPQRQVKPLPNGGGRQIAGGPGSPGNAQPRQRSEPVAAGTSLDSIILESMKEAGYNYNR